MSAKNIYEMIKMIETEFGSVDRVKRSEYVAVALGAISASIASFKFLRSTESGFFSIYGRFPVIS